LAKNNDYKPRHFRARQKSSEVRRMSVSSDASSAADGKNNILNQNNINCHGLNDNLTSCESDMDTPTKESTKTSMSVKSETQSNSNNASKFNGDDLVNDRNSVTNAKRRKSDENNVTMSSVQEYLDNNDMNASAPRKRNLARIQLAQQIIASST